MLSSLQNTLKRGILLTHWPAYPQTRVDFLVVPILTLGLFALQLDRGNMCVPPSSSSPTFVSAQES